MSAQHHSVGVMEGAEWGVGRNPDESQARQGYSELLKPGLRCVAECKTKNSSELPDVLSQLRLLSFRGFSHTRRTEG